MMRRLEHGGRIARERVLNFTFNGRVLRGFAGDTLASALLANGVDLVARSWKYHRPRGVLSAGVEEPNALVQLFEGGRTVPNARATEVELVDGLVARSVNAHPSVEFDARALNGWFSRLMPAGFYYKTFMASQAAWHFFERHIRRASGLGEAPAVADAGRYDKRFAHCDVLIVGGGIAGLCAALAAGRTGARVVVCDEQSEPGGWLLSSDEPVDGLSAAQWVARSLARLAEMPEVRVLSRTTAFGYHDHDFVTLAERRADHLPAAAAPAIRERLWKVRARQVVLATGAHERPLVFARNDLPGVMLASAVSTYLRRYAVMPGRRALLFTNNGAAYDSALALHAAGAQVTVVDARAVPDGDGVDRVRAAGIEILAGQVVTEASGGRRVRGAQVQALDADGGLRGPPRELACDLLAVSGGFSPVIHLQSQAGERAVWDDTIAAFLPGPAAQSERSAGGCRGTTDLLSAAIQGWDAGISAARLAGFDGAEDTVTAPPVIVPVSTGGLRALWLVPHPAGPTRAPKQFVDLQNDVAASDLLLAVREGFESIEHVKRYTAMGFGTDQGKTGNINGMGIVAQALGKPIAAVGTTTFRPNYTPVTFGLLAGPELGEAFDPVRTTPMHDWHEAQGAAFEDVGQWKRPWYYPAPGEDLHAAVRREVLAVRRDVGMLDASTLGKIDIQGPDAATLLNWVYCNAWSKLEVGKCRYGLMLDENGMVFDDGVTVRIAEHHYLMHTTTGGAARVLGWLERWHQTEWPHLKVYFTTVTDHWATSALAGPRSRDVLRGLCDDVDFDDDAFPFMSYREGTVAGVRARLMRISFSGERGYEINVPAAEGARVWAAIHEAGRPFGITAYGTEAMHVLRAEKGFIIVGQDTDGSVTPIDLGMSAMVAQSKDCIGKRSLSRADTARQDRKQFVGLLTDDPALVLPEGSQVLAGDPGAPLPPVPVPMDGHVTSSYASPTLGRSLALALVRGGLARMGQRVRVALRDGRTATAVIASPVFYDPKGERQHA
jgi:sarcosine oxidase subunit alpha